MQEGASLELGMGVEQCAPEQMPGAAPDGSGLRTKGQEPEGKRTTKREDLLL